MKAEHLPKQAAQHWEYWLDAVDSSSSQGATARPHHRATAPKLLTPIFQYIVDLMQGLSVWLWNSSSAKLSVKPI